MSKCLFLQAQPNRENSFINQPEGQLSYFLPSSSRTHIVRRRAVSSPIGQTPLTARKHPPPPFLLQLLLHPCKGRSEGARCVKSWLLLTVEFSVRLGRAAKALLMVQVSEREPCRGQTQPSPPHINLSAEGFRQSGVCAGVILHSNWFLKLASVIP